MSENSSSMSYFPEDEKIDFKGFKPKGMLFMGEYKRFYENDSPDALENWISAVLLKNGLLGDELGI